MNNNTSFNSLQDKDSFRITEYLRLLEQNPKERNKYKCPICEDINLSINHKTNAYKCYSNGCDTKKIAYTLRELNGEFKKHKDSNAIVLLHNNNSIQTSITSQQGRIRDAVTALNFFKQTWGDALAYNLRTKEPELDEKPINLDCIRVRIAQEFNIDISSADLAREVILFLAQERSYDPVQKYLEKCYRDAEPLPLKGLVRELFGVNDPLYEAYFRCWLIGSVARVMNPGCKFDEALILQGPQGYYKSTFFKVMANGFFSDSMKDPERRDDLLVMSQYWVLEWSELEKMTAKTYHSVIKDFLSKSEDTFRVPYGKDVQRVPRRSVIVGTTNQSEFLTDPTGNRRFWIIPVAKPIPIDFVETMRDMIWASAFVAYFKDESWQLPVELRQSQAEENRLYEINDVWEQVIGPWLETQEGLEITTLELLRMLEDKGYPVNYSKPEQMRCADILKRAGWKKERRMRGGKRLVFWVKG